MGIDAIRFASSRAATVFRTAIGLRSTSYELRRFDPPHPCSTAASFQERFAASSMPAEFAHQHRSNWKWVRGADLLLVAAVEASGIAILTSEPAVSLHSAVAVLLITCGVLALLSSAVIEPATTRAAFGRE